MQDRLRDQMAAYLAANRVATLCAAGPQRVASTLVAYRSHRLTLTCQVPGWSDALYYLEQNPQVALTIILGDQNRGLCWLYYQGLAQPAPPENLSNPLFRLIRVLPRRIDLIDEQAGPGVRTTLEVLASGE